MYEFVVPVKMYSSHSQANLCTPASLPAFGYACFLRVFMQFYLDTQYLHSLQLLVGSKSSCWDSFNQVLLQPAGRKETTKRRGRGRTKTVRF